MLNGRWKTLAAGESTSGHRYTAVKLAYEDIKDLEWIKDHVFTRVVKKPSAKAETVQLRLF